MTQLLPGMESEMRRRDLSQFYTPGPVARHMAKWARVEDGATIVEPAAGRGALILGIDDLRVGTRVWAWDIDAMNCAALMMLRPRQLERVSLEEVNHGDFLAYNLPAGSFDLALMNPPYEDGQDVRFIERGLDCSERVVGIFQSRIVHSQGRADCWRHTDITRMAILASRPHFGGPHSAKTDFVVLELVRRSRARLQGEATPAALEWWP
jgi:predicted RNA methylase